MTQTIDIGAMNHYADHGNGVDTALHVTTDPITDIREVTIYTDDRRGNGTMIFRVRYSDLLMIAAKYATILDQIES